MVKDLEIVVEELNQQIWNAGFTNGEHGFTYTTDGYNQNVSFNRYVLWDSIEDGRDYDVDTDTFEPLYTHILKVFKQYVNDLDKIVKGVK